MDVQLLRDSFGLVLERNDRVTARFYEILFERYPEVQRMFGRNSRPAQEKMLASALVAVVDHLEDAAWLDGTLGALGRAHVGYGVTDEMYDIVGECLLATLAEVAGDDWSAEVEGAWTEAYGAIRDAMLAGAHAVEAA
jgi:hemoglobin-like flavoprotein